MKALTKNDFNYLREGDRISRNTKWKEGGFFRFRGNLEVLSNDIANETLLVKGLTFDENKTIHYPNKENGQSDLDSIEGFIDCYYLVSRAGEEIDWVPEKHLGHKGEKDLNAMFVIKYILAPFLLAFFLFMLFKCYEPIIK